jgi:hypothetical protein
MRIARGGEAVFDRAEALRPARWRSASGGTAEELARTENRASASSARKRRAAEALREAKGNRSGLCSAGFVARRARRADGFRRGVPEDGFGSSACAAE